MNDDKYPLHHAVRVHPKAGNLGKPECPYCAVSVKEGNLLLGKSFGSCPADSFHIAYDGRVDKYFVIARLDDGRDLYGDTITAYGESDHITICPKCGRPLIGKP